MRFLSHGPTATVLMLIPVIIVPLLAILGVPQFAPGSASPQDAGNQSAGGAAVDASGRRSPETPFAPIRNADSGQPPPRPSETASTETASADPGVEWDDPFRSSTATAVRSSAGLGPAEPVPPSPTPDSSDSTEGRHGTPSSPEDAPLDWEPPAEAVQGWDWEEPRSGGVSPVGFEQAPGGALPNWIDLERPEDRSRDQDTAPPNKGETGVPPASNGVSAAQSSQALDRPRSASEFDAGTESWHTPTARSDLTWQAAVRRLNELGIRHFQLQPGVQENEFHFSCLFTPEDNPRITHRFEAEAKDPLRAVKKVLTQIDSWNKPR